MPRHAGGAAAYTEGLTTAAAGACMAGPLSSLAQRWVIGRPASAESVMVREIASGDTARAEPRWHEIQSALERVAALSTASVSSHDFHAALIQQAVAAVRALAGAVWLRSADGTLSARPSGISRPPRSTSRLEAAPSICNSSRPFARRGETCLWPPGRSHEHRQVRRGPILPAAPIRLACCSCFRRSSWAANRSA